MPTVYHVELVSMSMKPLAALSPSGYELKRLSEPELTIASPVVESPPEPAVVVPEQALEKKRTTPKETAQKRALEEVKKLPAREDKKKASPPPKPEVSRSLEKTESTPDASKKVEEIRKRMLTSKPSQSGDKGKARTKEDADIQILGGASGGSLLGRAHYGAVASMRMKMYLNQIRERIESVLVWPSTLEADQNWITRVSIRINQDGKIEKSQIEEKSGNSFFDDAVLRAMKKADPLPPLPDTYQGNVLEVLCAFHSKDGR